MVKKGFTVLELLIVLVIIGILATFGLTQFGRIVERSRGAEAKEVLGLIRKQATLFYLENNSLTPGGLPAFGNVNAGIGAGNDQIPGPAATDCRNSHYFFYQVNPDSTTQLTTWATRCTTGGRGGDNPPAAGRTLALRTIFPAGTDVWDPAGVGNPYGY